MLDDARLELFVGICDLDCLGISRLQVDKFPHFFTVANERAVLIANYRLPMRLEVIFLLCYWTWSVPPCM